MKPIYKIFKKQSKKIDLKIKIYLRMYIFMIWKPTQIKMINLKFTPAVMVQCNNLIEILGEIKTH